MRGELVESAVVGCGIDAPEPSATDIGDPWAELVAEQPEDAEDHVGIGTGEGSGR